jgi:hypothetical protein
MRSIAAFPYFPDLIRSASWYHQVKLLEVPLKDTESYLRSTRRFQLHALLLEKCHVK